MYRMIELAAIDTVDLAADVVQLFRAALLSQERIVLITREEKLDGYVYQQHLADQFTPAKKIADYKLRINYVQIEPGSNRDIVSVQRLVHTQLQRHFTESKRVQYVPIVDSDMRLLGAARRLRPQPEMDPLITWLRCHQENPVAVQSYVRQCLKARRVAIWCDGGALGELVIREFLDSDQVELCAILSDYEYITVGQLNSVSVTKLSALDVDIVIVAGGTASVADNLKRHTKAQVIRTGDLVTVTAKWLLGTQVLIDQALSLRQRGVTVRFISSPFLRDVINPSDRERQIMADSSPVLGGLLQTDRAKYAYRIEPVKSDHYSLDSYIDLIVNHQPNIIPRDGYTVNADTANPYFNYSDGRRLVTDTPPSSRNTIYIVGDSSSTNYYGDDSETIASYLQGYVNTHLGPDSYRVVDMGCSAQEKEQTARLVDNLELVPGDLVFVIAGHNLGPEFPSMATRNGVPFHDLTHLFNRPHQYGEVFIWHGLNHLNHRGQQVIAQELFSIGFDQKLYPLPDPASTSTSKDHPRQQILFSSNPPLEATAEFTAYLKILDDYRAPEQGTVGSIVMNCNPYTLGHRYLIETAAAECDHLYVFVVEEDRSVFPFADRMLLVLTDTARLKNVTVLPSGKFIISSLTFPDYFTKSEHPATIIDPSRDITLFGKHIAPYLGITLRFAGEEPLDLVTRQYNATMERLLPTFGISFKVIPRKEDSEGPISASRVRALLAEGDFDEIARLVPPITLGYLASRPATSISTANTSN